MVVDVIALLSYHACTFVEFSTKSPLYIACGHEVIRPSGNNAKPMTRSPTALEETHTQLSASAGPGRSNSLPMGMN